MQFASCYPAPLTLDLHPYSLPQSPPRPGCAEGLCSSGGCRKKPFHPSSSAWPRTPVWRLGAWLGHREFIAAPSLPPFCSPPLFSTLSRSSTQVAPYSGSHMQWETLQHQLQRGGYQLCPASHCTSVSAYNSMAVTVWFRPLWHVYSLHLCEFILLHCVLHVMQGRWAIFPATASGFQLWLCMHRQSDLNSQSMP